MCPGEISDKRSMDMKELELKYGCNPNQKPAKVYMESGDLPFTVKNGRPGYINLLDAMNKHVSPAGAAVAAPLSETLKEMYFAPDFPLTPLATAYVRARGADRMSSYGDFSALSDVCDVATAKILKHEVSDGVIAPGYEPEALEILKTKKKGNYVILEMDPAYEPAPIETKQVFGVTFEQRRNDVKIDEHIFDDIVTKNHDLPESAKRDLLIATITLKYTQSNSVCYAYDGQAIGIGAGQQSRVHCTRLAGDKADRWFLRQSPQVLGLPFKDDVRRPDRDNAIDVYIGSEWRDLLETDDWKRVFTEKPPVFTEEEKRACLQKVRGVSLGSDAFFPFGDNIERAHKSGVSYVAQTGGSIRDDNVIETADKYGMTMAMTHIRLFHH